MAGQHRSVSTSPDDAEATNEFLNGSDYPRKIYRAMRLLLEAFCYAQEANQDLWDFAVDRQDLGDVGLNRTDLRWLVRMGYVRTGEELASKQSSHRQFQRRPTVCLNATTCFVPTADGLDFAQRLVVNPAAARSARPTWDVERRELRLSGVVVKRYQRPSQNQERVLRAFQEECWRIRIDDPLPRATKQDPKERLRATIKAMNRNQLNHLIRFSGDGTGEGIRWRIEAAPKSAENHEACPADIVADTGGDVAAVVPTDLSLV